MHDPDSFKHVETRADGRRVYTTYRGTNGFGAVITQTVVTDQMTGELVDQ